MTSSSLMKVKIFFLDYHPFTLRLKIQKQNASEIKVQVFRKLKLEKSNVTLMNLSKRMLKVLFILVQTLILGSIKASHTLLFILFYLSFTEC